MRSRNPASCRPNTASQRARAHHPVPCPEPASARALCADPSGLPKPAPIVRVYAGCNTDLGARETDDGTPVHILNLDIKDNHDDASVGAQHILQLCRMVARGATRCPDLCCRR